jgi:hemolysin D
MIFKIKNILSKESIKTTLSKSKKFISNNISSYKILIRTQISGIEKNISLFKKKYEKEKIDQFTQSLNPKYKIERLQDFIERKLKSNSEETVLQQAKFWAQTITWTLISGTTFGIGWLAFAKTEEIVIATGKLEPKGGVIEVQMPFQGITKELLVKEGEVVKKGQVLIKLDTEVTKAKQKSILKTLEINQEILNSLELLYKEGATSKIQYLQQAQKVEELKSQVIENNVTLKYQNIISPVNGIVFNMKPKGAGFVARSSEPVLQVVPIDKLQAEVEVNSNDIGFIKIGKKADISIDSFPSSDFGVVEGKITRIGSDALPPEPRLNKGYRFPTIIELNKQTLILQSGQSLPLQAGMSITANIKLRKVSYLQLLLNNFKDKAKSLKEI